MREEFMIQEVKTLAEYLEIIEDGNRICNEYISLSKSGINNKETNSEFFNQYYNWVKDQKTNKRKKINSNNILFLYRGHSSLKYRLLPGTHRNIGLQTNESILYNELLVRCPEEFKNTSHLEKLVKMQHYGLTTRLLDVTTNPLVALYFACKGATDKGNGVVFIFLPEREELLFSKSDRALQLSCIPCFDFKTQKELFNIARRRLESKKNYFEKKTNSEYKDEVVEKFFHEISREDVSFKREIKPLDLLMPVFVQPTKSFNRMIKQDGAFILPGLIEKDDDLEDVLYSLDCVCLKISNQTGILTELEKIGICEASLFPEIEPVARYLNAKYETVRT